MNGYELVRLQPQQVKKSGDTITGDLTATGGAKFVGNLQGNATTATTLQNTRTINGTNFNGSANITTANWGTARNITIGNTAKSVNGSGNVTWNLNEIGAAASNHTHAGGTVNMNGYVKPGVGGAISANDTINQAIGKLEYGLDNKAPLNHNQGAHTINLMTGYNKGNHNGAIAQGDSLNVAIAKLENGVNSKANSNHNHDNRYLQLTGGTVTGQLNLQNSNLAPTGYTSLPNGLVEVWGTGVIDTGSVETAKTFHTLPAGVIGSDIYTVHAHLGGTNIVYCTIGVVTQNQIELDFRCTKFGGGLGVGLLRYWFRILARRA